MNPLETRPLPNAADKAVLKAIAVKVVAACPSLQDTAHEVANDLLIKFGVIGHDPDHVFPPLQNGPKQCEVIYWLGTLSRKTL